MLKTRVITALVLLVCFLAALFWLSALGWAVFVGLLVVPAAWEWGRLMKLARPGCIAYVVLIVILCALLYALTQTADSRQAALTQSAVYAVACLFWLVLVPLWLPRQRQRERQGVAALAGLIVLVPTWFAMIQLRKFDPMLLLMLMAVAWVSDIAAYFAGRKFGRHKLAPAISPGKTWEGVAGAVLAVTLYAALWSSVWTSQFPPLLRSAPFGAFGMLLFLWLLTAIGIYGDLFESALKRRAQVKDSGTLLPGHGGVLDRIDALTAVLPVAALVYSL